MENTTISKNERNKSKKLHEKTWNVSQTTAQDFDS
jgi:hypothetical protein